MRKKKNISLFLIFVMLFVMLSTPKIAGDKIRAAFVGATTPIWQFAAKMKNNFSADEEAKVSSADYLQLKLENDLLKKELNDACLLIDEALSVNRDMRHLSSSQTLGRYAENLKSLLEHKLDTVPAEVIYRAPTSWTSSLWINCGKSTNESLGKEIVAKNSPVVAGNALIGVIDYVGQNQSRVRLITDSELALAVRAARGQPQLLYMSDCFDRLMNHLSSIENPAMSAANKKQLLKQLRSIQKQLAPAQDTLYLAKGELHGSSQPLWRSKGALLKGVGFNYDFADTEGPARDLRTGIPFGSKDAGASIPLLKVHDILITTGMDGVFPAGLQVAEIVKIKMLHEGDYAYELLAAPIAGNLEELSLLFVMPPLGYQPLSESYE